MGDSNAGQSLIRLLAENFPGAFTQLLGSRPGQRAVEFVGTCQKLNILIGVFGLSGNLRG